MPGPAWPSRLGAGLAIAVVAGGCGLDAPPTCMPDGTGDDADALAATFSAGEYVDGIRTDGAAAFLYEPDPDQSLFVDEAVYVLCVGETAIEAGYTQAAPLLSDARAAVALRVATSLSGGDGTFEVEPGWLLGRVHDERIASLHVAWTGDDAGGSGAEGDWSVPLGTGLFLVHLPTGVPLEAHLNLRFVDADGDLVWSQPVGG